MNREEMKACIERARQGDRAALDQILRAIQGRLRPAASARLTRMIRDRMCTSDLLQSTYVNVVRGIDMFQGDSEDEFVVWVLRIMEHNVIDKARFFGRSKRQPPHAKNVEPDEEVHSTEPTPSKRAIQIEDIVIVSQVMDALPENQRQVVEMRMIEELPFEEIARRMNCSEGAVRMLLSRARAAMALELDRQSHED